VSAKTASVQEIVAVSDRFVPYQYDRPDSLPILTTKLYRPLVTADLEPRTELLERLDENRQRPLTLISAPAGYGKSTLASMWLEGCGCPSAWLALDEGDNDLLTFTSYLLAAVLRACPDATLKTLDLLEAPTMPPASVTARYLLNDLDQIQEPFILALDDLDKIHEGAIFDLLGELLRHPVRALHLVLITRRDPPLPIASLRARRQVTEVRARDLRFTAPESARLLSRMLERHVDEATAGEWTERTEGWVTALQLAALFLRHRGENLGLGAEIPTDSRYFQEYLLAEVLAHLDPVRQLWLLATSLLDRFCAPLCDAMGPLGGAGDEGALTGEAFVRWLEDDNLFLIPLDHQHQWFRYHHLFQQLLQESLPRHLSSDEIAALHRQASKWFYENGLWDEALQHAMDAEDEAAAAQIVVRHRYDLMNMQQWQRLDRWLQLLPADVVTQSPFLMSTRILLETHAHSPQTSALDSAVRHIERLLAALPLESEEYQVVWAETTVTQALLGVVLGEPIRSLASAQQSLQILPAQAYFVRTYAHAVVAASLQMRGDYELGFDMMNEAANEPGLPSNLQALALHFLCYICFMEGDLNGVMATSRSSLRIGKTSGVPRTIGHASQHLGITHYLRNELEEAEDYLLTVLENWAVAGLDQVASATIVLALIHLSRGRWDEAAQAIDVGLAQLDEMRDRHARAAMGAFRVELALWKGDLTEAQRLCAGVDFDLRPPSWYFYVPQLARIKLLWVEDRPESLARARRALESLDERMASIHRKTVRINVLSLLALVSQAQGDTAAAFDKLAQALMLAQPGGFIRNFVDLGPPMADLLLQLQRQNRPLPAPILSYVTRILAAFPPPDSAGPRVEPSPSARKPLRVTQGMHEPLTERESQILQLLATELSPDEIGQKLFVSTSTVRTHTRNIYAKLDVHRRFEAVHRARELGLL
jgi:LuxR family maltose regulon positive regulatory protein